VATRQTGSVGSKVRAMVARIVRQFHPERIILFGSRARSTAHRDSDIDILVVMDFDGSKGDAELAIRGLLHDIPVSKDIVVSQPSEFAWRKDVVGTIEYPAVREGRVLYKKPSCNSWPNRRMGGRKCLKSNPEHSFLSNA
jgi:predicted nucleotidyltransferase